MLVLLVTTVLIWHLLTMVAPPANILVRMLRVAQVVPVVITTLTPCKRRVPMVALQAITAPLPPRPSMHVLVVTIALICHRLTLHARRASILGPMLQAALTVLVAITTLTLYKRHVRMAAPQAIIAPLAPRPTILVLVVTIALIVRPLIVHVLRVCTLSPWQACVRPAQLVCTRTVQPQLHA